MTCAQLTWVLRMACSSALFCIPSGYDDADGTKKIQQLASFKNIKGAQVSLMERRRNKMKHVENESIRKKWKDHGRLGSLLNQMKKGRFDNEGRKISMKYFGVPPESLSFGAVYGLQKQTNIEIDKRQKNIQSERLCSWKART